MQFTVINQGSVAATGQWTDSVYLSLDNVLGNADDVLMISTTNGAALGSGEEYATVTDTFTIPKRYQGPAYLLIKADANDAVDEAPNEDNNIYEIPITITPFPKADLVTSDVVSATQAFDGTQIEVRFQVSNQGIGPTDATSWTDSVWLTTDRKRPHPAKGDVLLTTLANPEILAVGESYEQIVTVTLPKRISGEYFITPWSDVYDAVLEDTFSGNINPDDPNEFDNNNYKARPITVLLTPPPDLVVTSVVPSPATTTAGNSLIVRWTVQNQGTNATEESSIVDAVYLADTPDLNTATTSWLLGTVPHDGILASGASYSGEAEFLLSPAVSSQYVIVQTNVGSSAVEPAWEGPLTGNNARTAAALVTPAAADLQVTSVVTPANSFSGEQATIQWTVQNDGAPVWSHTRYWTDHVYISPDATLLPHRATYLGSFIHSQEGPLGSGESYTETHEIGLPRGLGGTYYIYVFTDFDIGELIGGGPFPSDFGHEISLNTGSAEFYASRIYEGEGADERNNIGSTSIPITYREPDLQVTNLTVPSTATEIG